VPRIHFVVFAMFLTMASAAVAQQPGWGTQPTQPTQPGWGTQPPPPTPPPPTPPPTQPGWGTQPTQPGWGTQPNPPPPTPPPPPPPSPPPPPPEEPETPAAPIEGGNIGLGFSNHFAPMFNSGNLLAATLTTSGVAAAADIPGDAAASQLSSYYVNLSMRYRLTAEHEIEAILGFSYLNLTHADWDDPLNPVPPEEISMDGFMFHLAARYLYTIAGNARARLYTGAGIGFLIATASGDQDDADYPGPWQDWLGWGITIGAPLGFEYRFEAAPQLALSLEVSFALGYVSGTMTSHPASGDLVTPTTEDSGGSFLLGLGQAADLTDQIYIPIIDYVSFGLHYYF
jgi:hypothetical protein